MCFLCLSLALAFGFLDRTFGINDPNHIAVQREQLCGGLKILRIDIFLFDGIRPLQGCRDQLHQMIHDHATTFLGIEQRVSEPGVDAPRPLPERKLWKDPLCQESKRGKEEAR